MKKVDDVIKIYDKMSEREKVSLFLSLSKKDMKEYFDPSYSNYRLIVKNKNGKFLIDTILPPKFFNEREAKRYSESFINYRRFQRYNRFLESSLKNLKEKKLYREKTFSRIKLEEIK